MHAVARLALLNIRNIQARGPACTGAIASHEAVLNHAALDSLSLADLELSTGLDRALQAWCA